MTFIKQGFRVSVVSDVRERVQDLWSPLHLMLRRSSLVKCISVLHGTCLQCVEFFLRSCTLSRTSDTTDTRNPCLIKVILLACSTYIDIFLFINSLLTYYPLHSILPVNIVLCSNSLFKLTSIIKMYTFESLLLKHYNINMKHPR
jgi:hypothetical protein